MFILPIHWSGDRSTLMCCQQPLDISATQLLSLERIDALFNIRCDKTALGKILLTLLINLWFSSPGLPLCLPVGAPLFRCPGSRLLMWRRYLLYLLPVLQQAQYLANVLAPGVGDSLFPLFFGDGKVMSSAPGCNCVP